MSWASRSAGNIFPHSVEQYDLATAFGEWTYTGDMYDLEEPVEICELCNHKNIRYQFTIRNRHNDNQLLVGSECINKFHIKAVDTQGVILDQEASRKKVNQDKRYLVDEARKRHLINALLELSTKDDEFDIETFIDYEQNRGAFTPSQLFTLFWRLKEHQVKFNPTHFKLTIRRKREKQQLLAMELWKIQKLWSAMSTTQKTWVKKNTGHTF